LQNEFRPNSFHKEIKVYGFNVQVHDKFDQAVARVTEALKTEGFDARHPWRALRWAR